MEDKTILPHLRVLQVIIIITCEDSTLLEFSSRAVCLQGGRPINWHWRNNGLVYNLLGVIFFILLPQNRGKASNSLIKDFARHKYFRLLCLRSLKLVSRGQVFFQGLDKWHNQVVLDISLE